VRVDDIQRDERVNTRPVDTSWVTKRVDKFSPDALGVPAVSLRPDETYIVLNGQHRLALLRACGFGDTEIQVEVYEGLNLAEEAGLFTLLNDGRRLTAIHLFLARVTSGDEIACKVQEIAERHSWRIGNVPGPGIIQAVSALENLHKKDLKRNSTPTVLENTLSSIAQAWGHSEGAQHSAILTGVGNMFLMFGDKLDKDRLVLALTSYEGGPLAVLGAARGRKVFTKGAIANSVADIIREEYNDTPGGGRKLDRFR
jgi:hypothetical protein